MPAITFPRHLLAALAVLGAAVLFACGAPRADAASDGCPVTVHTAAVTLGATSVPVPAASKCGTPPTGIFPAAAPVARAPSRAASADDPQTWVVTTTADSDDGACTAKLCSLRDAVTAAAQDDTADTITFDADVRGTITLTNGEIDQNQAVVGDPAAQPYLSIVGPGPGQLTIDGDENGPIFNAGAISISGLTFEHGSGWEGMAGGAIYGQYVKLDDDVFRDNHAGGVTGSADHSGAGAGGAVAAAVLTVTDSTFIDNSAGGDGADGADSGYGVGGAIADSGFPGLDDDTGALVVSGSTFVGNHAGGNGSSGDTSGGGWGGAIADTGASLTTTTSISSSTFTGNSAGGNGGSGGVEYVELCGPGCTDLGQGDLFYGAAGSGYGQGGAVYIAGGPTTLTDSTLSDDHAGGNGGLGEGSGAAAGGAISAPQLTVAGSTLDDDSAGGDGGGGAASGGAYGGAIMSSKLSVTSSTVDDDSAGGSGADDGDAAGLGYGGALVAEADAQGLTSFPGSLTIDASTLAGDRSGGDGGGGSDADIGYGGAAAAFGVDFAQGESIGAAPAQISNSTFTDDTAGGSAGVGASGVGFGSALVLLVTNSSPSQIVDDTIDSNHNGAGAEGVSGGALMATDFDAVDTIVASNTGGGTNPNCVLAAESSSGSIEGPAGQASCGFDLPSADPLLGPLADNNGPVQTQALAPGSPALGAGGAPCPEGVDARGLPRPGGGETRCDAGAYEAQVLTVTAPSESSVFGSAPPSDLSPTYRDPTGGDGAPATPASCSDDAHAGSPVGTYPITCTGAADPRYLVNAVAGTLTITPAPLTITAPSATIDAGVPIPVSFAPAYSGLIAPDSAPAKPPSCTAAATAASLAGTYPITCSGAADPNYAIAYAAGRLTIRPAPTPVTTASRAAAPSNRFRIVRIVTRPNGLLRVRVKFPGRGRVDVLETAWFTNEAKSADEARTALLQPARGRFVFSRARFTARRAGTVQAVVRPNARGRRLIGHHTYRVTIRLWLTFTPTGGHSRSKGVYGLHFDH